MSAFKREPCRVDLRPVPLSPEDLMSEQRRKHHIDRLRAQQEKEIHDSNVVSLAQWREAIEAQVEASERGLEIRRAQELARIIIAMEANQTPIARFKRWVRSKLNRRSK